MTVRRVRRARRAIVVPGVLVLLALVGGLVAWRVVDGEDDVDRSTGAVATDGDRVGEEPAARAPTEQERMAWLEAAAYDGEELVVVGNRRRLDPGQDLGPQNRFALDNGPWAYDPAAGTWRDLPPLGLDQPLVGASAYASRLGTIVVGTACGEDSPGFTDGVDDVDEQHGRPPLECRPGTRVAAIRWTGTEAFEPLALPGGPDGRAHLVASGTAGEAIAVLGGHVRRLQRDGTWAAVPAPTDGVAEACPLGDRLVALARPPRFADGSVGELVLAELAPGAEAWQRIAPLTDLAPQHLTCGDDVALVELAGVGEAGQDQGFVVLRADGTHTVVASPPFPAPSSTGGGTGVLRTSGRLQVPRWDGHGFVAEADGAIDLDAKVALPEDVYVLDPGSAEAAWLPAAPGTVDLDRYADVLPLDGSTALYRLQLPMSLESPYDQEPSRWQVAPVLRPA